MEENKYKLNQIRIKSNNI